MNIHRFPHPLLVIWAMFMARGFCGVQSFEFESLRETGEEGQR
jgi:hypothetical protein